jgi:hypothetical protein
VSEVRNERSASELKTGDRVRVTYEAAWDQDRGTHYWLRDLTDGTTASVPKTATVELIEPADDPSKDPVGTVRREDHGEGFSLWQAFENQHGERTWLCTWSTVRGNRGVHLWDKRLVGQPVIGSVPGTPAAEAQKPRAPWTVDGSEEPPAHVKKVRDKDGDTISRNGDGWNYNPDAPGVIPWQWTEEDLTVVAPLTEVID